MPAKAKAGGRQRKSAQEIKSHTMVFRARDSMRDRLHGAAEESGRSVSEEIEARLARSFLTDDGLGGSHVSALARMVAVNVLLAEEAAGASFTISQHVRELASSAIKATLDYYITPPRLLSGGGLFSLGLTHEELMKKRLQQDYAGLTGGVIASLSANYAKHWALVEALSSSLEHSPSAEEIAEIVKRTIRLAEERYKLEIANLLERISDAREHGSDPS